MKSCALPMGLLALSLVSLPSTPALAAVDIPTSVTGPTAPPEYPDPICATCAVRTVTAGNNHPDRAFVEIEFLESAPFQGTIEVTVMLSGGGSDVLLIDDVSLAYSDVAIYEVLAEPTSSTWVWSDVETVWLELVPDA